MTALPEKFISRMKAELGSDFPSFIECYEKPPVRGLRVNTLKISPEAFRGISPWPLEETGIIPEGFIVGNAENVGRHPFHAAGLFYMQEPSAMSVIRESGVGFPDENRNKKASSSVGFADAFPSEEKAFRVPKVLDLCAAPGGKSGGIAARMKGRGILVSNEIVPKRAVLLSRSLERLGVTNAAVTSAKPEAIANALPRYFDLVLVDAPCSGEGMFRKDETAIAEWSPEHVASCAVRQSLILESAAECVASAGALVYSTCTFSRDENEGVIDKFLCEHKDFSVEHMERLYPHASCGEGHFVCRLRREGERSEAKGYKRIAPCRDRAALSALGEFISSTVKNGLPEGTVHLAGDSLRLIPPDMPEAVLKLHPVSAGVALGTLRKGRLEPSHSFFMSELGMEYLFGPAFEADDPALAAFMSGSTVACSEELRGFCPVCVKAGGAEYPIGFGKAVGGVIKNHLPKGLYLL